MNSKHSPAPLPIAVVALLAALGAGCGGSTDGGSAPDRAERQPLLPPDSQALGPRATAPAPAPAGTLQGRVIQTIDAGPYTYVEVEAGGGSAWAAAPQLALAEGTLVRFATGMPMANYHSETLDRTFELVYFTDDVLPVDGGSAAAGSGQLPPGHPPLEPQASQDQPGSASAGTPAGVDLSGIEPPEDGLRVEQVHARSAELAGQRVAVRGRVVKFTPGVMGHNWLHLQDGSGEGATADLTVVTDDLAQVGDLVTATGLVAVDQDFGFDYQYPVLLQDATIRAD